jgi:DNA-binding beta-propeller fold protein YncE
MNIYVLKPDGSLLKFLQGVQETFEITGLDKPLASPTQVLADYDFDNIYVADSGNNRVVVLDKKGALVKQILSNDPQTWNNIKGIAVSPDEKTLYVLDGTVVYSASL